MVTHPVSRSLLLLLQLEKEEQGSSQSEVGRPGSMVAGRQREAPRGSRDGSKVPVLSLCRAGAGPQPGGPSGVRNPPDDHLGVGGHEGPGRGSLRPWLTGACSWGVEPQPGWGRPQKQGFDWARAGCKSRTAGEGAPWAGVLME